MRHRAKLDDYRRLEPATLVDQEARLVLRYGRDEVVEGAATEDMMIAELPAFDAVHT